MGKSLAVVSLENVELKEKIQLMRELGASEDKKRILLQNTMEALVGMFQQSNLTSFAPLINNNIYAPTTLNWPMLMYAYKTHGPLQTAHDQPVLDAFRGGLELHSDQIEPQELKDLEDRLEIDNIYETWIDVIIWKRLFGGSALIINTEQDPATPLVIERLKRNSKIAFYDASRWELGSPMRLWDSYLFYGQQIDKTRVLTQVGKRAPWLIRQQLAGWGMSEMERMLEPFNIYLRAMNVIYELLNEAKIDVYSLKDFNKQLATAPGTNLTYQRIQFANRIKNYMNAVVLDKDDEYTQKQIAFSGLAEMANEARLVLAASLKMPISKLFGAGSKGFSNGEDDLENYNSMVEAEVREPAKPMIRETLKILSQVMFGKAFDISFKYKPLRLLSPKEEEEVRTIRNDRYQVLYQNAIMNGIEWARLAHKDGIVAIELEAGAEGAEKFPLPPIAVGAAGEGFGGGDDKEKGEK